MDGWMDGWIRGSSQTNTAEPQSDKFSTLITRDEALGRERQEESDWHVIRQHDLTCCYMDAFTL